ncbi:hypothetical protein [Halegenticoccus tardaugens]|uniref:hypothetical protein n=1 Tax=Halegenticoccus tardaugens TaxID=2071624 RepID=UPI00100C11E3|nr:hypothetical protein [Halegenticoccus tardaugens]
MVQLPKRKPQILLYGLVLMVAFSAVTAPVAGQEGEGPVVTLSAANGDLTVGETTQVTSNYEFAVEEPGSGEQALSAVSGTIWLFPGTEVQNVQASVNGQPVEPTVDRSDRYMTVSVPVSDVSAGETVTVGMSYSVSGEAGSLNVPLWVPEYETTGSNPVVSLTITLPEGQQVQGSAFPKLNDQNGNVVTANLLHMPGFVKFNYGSGASSFFTIELLSTVIGVALIVGILGGWFAWTRGYLGGDAHVA